MIKISIDDREVKTLLHKLQRKMSDMTPAMRAISAIMKESVEENFEKEGRPKWQSLSPKTIKQREKEGKWPGKMLQKSAGGLAVSITSSHDSHSAQVGTNKVYAAIHQLGGRIPARTIKPKNAKALKIPAKDGFIFRKKASLPAVTIPARPFLKLADNDLENIREAIKKHLTPS